MIAFIDVGYTDKSALAACVTVERWTDASPHGIHTIAISDVAEYIPGEFYRRELPCIQQVLGQLPERPDIIVVDGFVWLDADGKKGLGAKLFDELGGITPVVGIAKTSFATATSAVKVFRGTSNRPLFVTAVGFEVTSAADAIKQMHGSTRLPTILTLVDRLSKGKPVMADEKT